MHWMYGWKIRTQCIIPAVRAMPSREFCKHHWSLTMHALSARGSVLRDRWCHSVRSVLRWDIRS